MRFEKENGCNKIRYAWCGIDFEYVYASFRNVRSLLLKAKMKIMRHGLFHLP